MEPIIGCFGRAAAMDAALVVVFTPPRQRSPLRSRMQAKVKFKALFSHYSEIYKKPACPLELLAQPVPTWILSDLSFAFAAFLSHTTLGFSFYLQIYQVRDLPEPP